MSQFEPLLKYFGQVADVFAVDLPGCGRSPFVHKDGNLYTTDALATLVNRVLDEKLNGRKVILIGHSMGATIVATLARRLGNRCLAQLLLCPRAEISDKERTAVRLLAALPEFLFNVFRKRDRMYSRV